MSGPALEAIREAVLRDGYAVATDVLPPDTVSALTGALDRLEDAPGIRRRGESTYGMRNVLEMVPLALETAESAEVRGLVEAVLGPGAFPVHARLFDKTAAANWRVGWHQDLIVPVRERRETPGFSGWTVKAGVPHVHPPADVLAGMLAVRLHLDDCGPENGPLRVVPGSHREGKLDAEAAWAWRERVEAVTLSVPRGGALLMRPLLLHASSPAETPGRRRVLHVEYAAAPLPGGLEWARPTSAAAPASP